MIAANHAGYLPVRVYHNHKSSGVLAWSTQQQQHVNKENERKSERVEKSTSIAYKEVEVQLLYSKYLSNVRYCIIVFIIQSGEELHNCNNK